METAVSTSSKVQVGVGTGLAVAAAFAAAVSLTLTGDSAIDYAALTSAMAEAKVAYEAPAESAFDGTTSSMVDLADFSAPDGSKGRVVRLEVMPGAMDKGARAYFFSYGKTPANRGVYMLGLQDGDVLVSNGGTSFARFDSDLSPGRWHEVVAFSGGNAPLRDTAVFVDGKRASYFRGNNQNGAFMTVLDRARLGADLTGALPYVGSAKGLRVFAYPFEPKPPATPPKKRVEVPDVPGFTGEILVNGQTYVKGCTNCPTDPNAVPKASRVVRPQDFGAKGDGVTDDTAAIQSALNAAAASGGEVEIPAGTYIVDKLSTLPTDTPTHPPQYDPNKVVDAKYLKYLEETIRNPQLYGTRRRTAALFMHGMKNVVVRCAGPSASVIKKKGGDYGTQDYSTVEVRNSNDITFVNCGWDGNMQNVTEGEQAHTINVLANDTTGAPSRGLRVLGNVFRNVKGDGIRFVGGTETYIRDVIVARNVFDVSKRSGIGVQRGIDHLWFVENRFSNITDQYIDFEPTGGEEYEAPSDILIADNLFSQHQRDSYVLSVGGLGSKRPSRRILVKDNIMFGSVNARNLEDASFINNMIDASAPNIRTTRVDGTPINRSNTDNFALHVNGYLKNVRFEGGKLLGKDRGAYIVQHSGNYPTKFVIDNVEIRGARGLEFHSSTDFYVVNSKLVYAPFDKTAFDPTQPTRGIHLESEAPGFNLSHITVANNEISGFGTPVLVNARSGNTISDVRLFDNAYSAPAGTPFLTKLGPVNDVTESGNVLK